MSNNPVLLAIDQGTTSSRAIVFSHLGKPLVTAQKELELFYPHDGWVEQDASAIWDDVLAVTREAASKASGPIAGIGITNQRETTVVWDRKTGEPLYHAIVWQDRRTADICTKLKEAGHEQRVSEVTGLLLDPYFSATKIGWILDHVKGSRARAEAGELAFGTIESWLVWKLTKGEKHITDVTNASRTLLMNLDKGMWDEEMLTLFNIPKSLLPEIVPNCGDFGETDQILPGHTLPICGMAGDQQAALIGQACFEEGMVKATYGTGCFALINTGKTRPHSKNRLLATCAYDLGQGEGRFYALEGAIFVAGAAIQWLRDQMKFFTDAAQSEALAKSANQNTNVMFVPAFTGLGAPYWDPHARAAIFGLTREAGQAEITLAALEAQGFQSLDLKTAMEADTGLNSPLWRVDGGLVANSLMCQRLADITGTRIEVTAVPESTALGAAFLAGLHTGVFKSLEAISQVWQASKSYKAQPMSEALQRKTARWSKAVSSVQNLS